MDDWEQIHELWLRQQRGEPPNKDAKLKEQHYYNLIEQIEGENCESKQIPAVQFSGGYSVRLETKEPDVS